MFFLYPIEFNMTRLDIYLMNKLEVDLLAEHWQEDFVLVPVFVEGFSPLYLIIKHSSQTTHGS